MSSRRSSRRGVRGVLAAIALVVLSGCADESARPVLGPASTAPGGDATSGEDVASTDVPTTSVISGLQPLDGFGDVVLRVVNDGATTQWPMLHAGTVESRRQGLMGVTDLEGFAGMVFSFDADTEAAFWMRNTPMPLSIAFVRVDGRIVSMVDMEPCDDSSECPTYPPAGPYRFAVEVPQGRFLSMGVEATSVLAVG